MKRTDDRDEKTSTGRTQVIRWSEQTTKMTLLKCKLSITSGDSKGKEFVLTQPVIRVGTKKENEIVLKD